MNGWHNMSRFPGSKVVKVLSKLAVPAVSRHAWFGVWRYEASG